MASRDDELMSQVARLYYLQGATRVQISQRLGISRFKVARLLETALETGLVTITLRPSALVDAELSDALAARFGLHQAYAVRVEEAYEGADQPRLYDDLGRVAAGLLAETVTRDDVLGFDSGRTVSHIADHITHLPPCDVVQLTGLLGTVQRTGHEILRRVTSASGGNAFPVFAPMIAADQSSAEVLRQDPILQATMAQYKNVTRAVVSIGSWTPPESQVYDHVGPNERKALVSSGVVAETCAIMFDKDGHPVRGLDDRRIGIPLSNLRSVPNVIGVAGGPSKLRAIATILEAGILNTLVTDEATARALLASPAARPR